MNPTHQNSYMKAIQSVGTVIQDYDRYFILFSPIFVVDFYRLLLVILVELAIFSFVAKTNELFLYIAWVTKTLLL